MLNLDRIQLVGAACERDCPTCFRDCAAIGIRLDWWRGELARLIRARPKESTGQDAVRLTRWRADLEEAQAHVSDLTAKRKAAEPDTATILPFCRSAA